MNIIGKKINGNEQYRHIMTGFHRFRIKFCQHIIAGFQRFGIKFRWHMIAGLCGFLTILQGKIVSADLIDTGDMRYSNAPGEPWMETAVIIIVGLMVILAIGAVVFLHHQKKQEEQERMQREEAEKCEKMF